jgi:UDP-N-acetyl-D-mannosaminuronic acid dehydrogenase
MKEGTSVIVESTVAPRTSENVVKKTIEKFSDMMCGAGFDLAFLYERVMSGKLIQNIVHLSRVVGGTTELSTERAVEMYSKIVKV